MTGNAQQVISACTRVNTALQEMVDRGALGLGHFVEVAGDCDAAAGVRGAPAAGPPPSVAEAVRSARLAPAAGFATQPPHSANINLGRISPLTAEASQLPSRPVEDDGRPPGEVTPVQRTWPTIGEMRDPGGCEPTYELKPSVSNSHSPMSSPAANHFVCSNGHTSAVYNVDPKLVDDRHGGFESRPQDLDRRGRADCNGQNSAAKGFDRPEAASGHLHGGVHAAACFPWQHGHAFCGQSGLARMRILIPCDVVDSALVPDGHFAEVARECGVQIDLVALHFNAVGQKLREVILQGDIVSNAMAVLQLQWRLALCTRA
eukprot:TRINITY_DN37382_c0_g1_i3.p1 TRINITY_DN37382_c0_g1~~TRINITY_DN37382_c0_g1_i3.p1  ORF type:complete len:318 (+),score=49.27 TRINITY_DN37382_c0_g1_i3:189-1142(+)